ncbi:hypothetical protein BDZ91DRAFT_442776 [Kalaharituber pfeilii]|nr:hypothetical protein BDZ91DRAFT_442776 [Kalaharituber pfeilii]
MDTQLERQRKRQIALGLVIMGYFQAILLSMKFELERRRNVSTVTSRYRPPIPYEQYSWTLLSSGWSDTECIEYLRFT